MEEISYRAGCEVARAGTVARLKQIDDELLSRGPKGWSVVTRFGDVPVRHRLYRDSEGETVFALDEHMAWKPRQLASTSIAELVVDMPFRKVCDVNARIGRTPRRMTMGNLAHTPNPIPHPVI